MLAVTNITATGGGDDKEADRLHSALPKSSVLEYIKATLGEKHLREITWIHTKRVEGLHTSVLQSDSGVGNTIRINDIRNINRYFEYLNRDMPTGNYLISSVETQDARKERLYNKYPPLIRKIYYLLDFIIKRVFPKWKPTRAIYFHLTDGRNRVLSISEVLGRLICCGYEIIDYKKVEYNTWIIAKKVKKPTYDRQATYGALIRLKRIGKDGEIIKVYKLRTMYPYSEYLQEYVYDLYDLKKGGKFKNDFRNTSYGQFFRKYWLDELPMFINYFKGELKLVGVRPLSRQYFALYPKELRELRIKVKPGLIPPYYADMPNDLKEIQESERDYIASYLEKPIFTDIRYFFKVAYNIIFNGARSA